MLSAMGRVWPYVFARPGVGWVPQPDSRMMKSEMTRHVNLCIRRRDIHCFIGFNIQIMLPDKWQVNSEVLELAFHAHVLPLSMPSLPSVFPAVLLQGVFFRVFEIINFQIHI